LKTASRFFSLMRGGTAARLLTKLPSDRNSMPSLGFLGPLSFETKLRLRRGYAYIFQYDYCERVMQAWSTLYLASPLVIDRLGRTF
jgi:hypothetical protein